MLADTRVAIRLRNMHNWADMQLFTFRLPLLLFLCRPEPGRIRLSSPSGKGLQVGNRPRTLGGSCRNARKEILERAFFTAPKGRTMQTRFTARALLLVLLCSLLSQSAFGQAEAGSVAGTVTDQSGAMVTGATVIVKNLGTNAARITQSSATGDYAVVGLAPATYEVTVTAGAFKPFTAKVEVTVGRHVTLAARLSVGATTTEVRVVAEGGTAVNTRTQELSQIIDTEQLAQLPSLTRNPYDFIALLGNVSNTDNTTSNSTSGQNIHNRGVGYSLNGQRQSGTEILLDGVENVNWFQFSVGQAIPVDAVQEYSIVTNNYTAE